MALIERAQGRQIRYTRNKRERWQVFLDDVATVEGDIAAAGDTYPIAGGAGADANCRLHSIDVNPDDPAKGSGQCLVRVHYSTDLDQSMDNADDDRYEYSIVAQQAGPVMADLDGDPLPEAIQILEPRATLIWISHQATFTAATAFGLTGRTNDAVFEGNAQNTMLFMGASPVIRHNKTAQWTVTHTFAYDPNTWLHRVWNKRTAAYNTYRMYNEGDFTTLGS